MTKRQIIFQSVGISLAMSLAMSLVMGIKALGLTPLMFKTLPGNMLVSFLVSLPLSFLLPPLMAKLIKIWHI